MLRTSSKRRLLGGAGGIVLIFLAIDTNGQTLPGGSNPPLANGTVKGIAAGDGTTITCTAGICIATTGGTAGISQLTGDVTAGPGSGSQFATITAGTVTLSKMANLPANSIIINNTGSAAVPASAALPACADSGGNHLNYASGAFSCGTSSSGGGSSAFASLTSGTNTTAAMLVGTGASLGPTASGTVTANAVSNGTVALAGMANLAANSIIGNNTGSPAAPIALTAAQVKTLLAIAPSDLSGLGTGVATALGSAVSGTGAICLASGSACSGAAGVSSITSGTPALTFNASTGAVTANLTVVNNTQAIASYTIAASDNTKVVNRTYSAGALTDTLPNVSTTGFGAGFGTTLAVNSSQPDTLTVTAPSTINGVSSITIPAHAIVNIADPDGLNYIAERIQEPSNVAITGGSINGTTIGITTPAAGAFTTLSATGKTTTAASAAGGAGLNLPHGTAPTSPVNGDCWTTTAGLYCQINGATVGPFGTGAGGGNVNTAGTLTNNAVVLGAGSQNVGVLGSLGTTTTVLHGNAGGAPTFGAVANADLANSATTVNGQTCTLGSTCTVWGQNGTFLNNGFTTTTEYMGIWGAPIANTTDGVCCSSISVMPLAGTMGHLHVTIKTAQGASTSSVWTIRLCPGGSSCAATAQTCTITNPALTCSDDSDTFTYSAGDWIELQYAAGTGTPTTTGGQVWSFATHQ